MFRRSKLRRLAVLLPAIVRVATGELAWTNSSLLGWLAGRLAQQSGKRQVQIIIALAKSTVANVL